MGLDRDDRRDRPRQEIATCTLCGAAPALCGCGCGPVPVQGTYSPLGDVVGVGMWSILPDGTIESANQVVGDMLGRAPGSLEGMHVHDLLPMGDRATAGLEFKRFVEGASRHIVIERMFLHAEGHLVPTRIFAGAIRDDDGRLVRSVTVVEDLSDEERFESTWREVALHLPLFIITVDRDRRILFINKTLPGLSLRDAIGSRVEDWIRDEDHEHVKRCVEEAFSAGTSSAYETGSVGPDGREARYHTQVMPVRRAGETVHVSLIARDITEEIALATARDAAQQRKSRLVHAVGHDLLNPFTPIGMYLDMLKDSIEAPTVLQMRALSTMERNLERVVRLIHDLRDVHNIEDGEFKVELGTTDLAPEAESTVDLYSKEAEGRGITIVLDVEGAYHVQADPDRIGQVIGNLLRNAIKFSSEGGEVRVRLERRDDLVALSVQDNGRGLTTDERARLFQPFVQVHEAHEASEPGTGLGLFIARRIIEAHGGTIDVESAGKGKGSTFTFTVPAAKTP